MNEIKQQLLNASQAARYLGMSRFRFYTEIAKGLIRQHVTPAAVINGNKIPAKRPQYYIKDLDNYILKHLKYSDTSIATKNIIGELRGRKSNIS